MGVTRSTPICASAPQWLHSNEEPEWDRFVDRHPQGLIYHSSAWKQLIEKAFPHIRGRILVLRDPASGEISAGLPVYTVKSWLLGNRVVSVPFASFCDPLLSTSEELAQFVPELAELCRANSARLEVRAVKTAPLFADAPLAVSATYKHHYLLLDKDLKTLFGSFAKSSICQKITKAAKLGVVIEQTETVDGLKTCHNILVQTRRRLALPPMPFSLFSAMYECLGPERLKTYLAFQNGKPVGCHLMLCTPDLWISEYSGNSDDAVPGINQLLYWDTIQRAHAAGARAFSFGRTACSNEGLLAYKRRWATVEEDMVTFTLASKKQASKPADDSKQRENGAAYRMLRFVLTKAPAPLYKTIGEFCYRHLG